MQYVRAQKNKKNIRRILKSVENKWECASINGTVDRSVLVLSTLAIIMNSLGEVKAGVSGCFLACSRL